MTKATVTLKSAHDEKLIQQKEWKSARNDLGSLFTRETDSDVRGERRSRVMAHTLTWPPSPHPNLALGKVASQLVTVAVAVSVAAEHVVESLQEEKHYDASECCESIQGVEDMGITSFWRPHIYGLRGEKAKLGSWWEGRGGGKNVIEVLVRLWVM